VTGVAELPDGVEMVMPGDNVQLAIELITPVALERVSVSPSARAAARGRRHGFGNHQVTGNKGARFRDQAFVIPEP